MAVCLGARWHVFGFGKLAYSHAQFSKWSERWFSLSAPPVTLYTLWRSSQCSMLHAASERRLWSLNVLLFFFSSQQHISTAESALLRARGATRDGEDGTIYTEDASRRFLSRRWRDICFSFLRLSHSLVLWHYVFRRGRCSCLHGEAEDVDLCTCFLCFKMTMHSPFPVHITNTCFLFAVPSRRGCVNPAAVIDRSDAECYWMTCSSA